jgi:hypothetical protein
VKRGLVALIALTAASAVGACGSSGSAETSSSGPDVSRAGGTAVTTVAPTAPAGNGTATGNGTVTGVVTAGPTCPVQRADVPCPPRPLQVDVVGRDRTGDEAARAHSAADGSFTMSLPAGYYELEVVTSDGVMRCPARGVDVVAGATVRADIACDTGMR